MKPVAAIDCGTNSTRLLIAGADGTALAREMQITRLGAGVDRSGRLASDAIERVVSCLHDYRRLIDAHGVALDPSSVRIAATSAARDASNRDELFDAIESVVGVRPVLLSGDDEGRVNWAGASIGLIPRRDASGEPALDLLVDIGGGSTEFIIGRGGEEPVGVCSIDVGCVRCTEQFLRRDPPTAEELSQAISVVHAYLDDVERELPAVREAARLIGVAGTVTTMAAIEIGLPAYNRDRTHHFVLSRTAAEDVFRTVATERRADRGHNPGLAADRVDTIVAGALILVTIMRHFDFGECLVSETDSLDGLVALLRA